MFEKLREYDLCPYCQKGQLELKSSRFGEFLGCSRFPQCAGKVNLKEPDSEYVVRKKGEYID